jgi:predicted ATPase
LERILGLFKQIREDKVSAEIHLEGKKRTLFRAIRDFLGSILASGPIILVLDDMQWVDSTTREFLFFLLRSLRNVPLLVVCVGRATHEEWGPDAPHDLIRLKPFSEMPAHQIFHSVLGTNLLDPKISEEILSQAGGNPLFLVEMAETLERQELLVCDSRQCTLRLEVEDLEIPGSIQGVLAARLDALPEECKRVVQLASIMRKSIWEKTTSRWITLPGRRKFLRIPGIR